MIPDFDKTAPFVWSAFAIGIGIVAIVIAYTLLRARTAKARLAALEAEVEKNA